MFACWPSFATARILSCCTTYIRSLFFSVSPSTFTIVDLHGVKRQLLALLARNRSVIRIGGWLLIC